MTHLSLGWKEKLKSWGFTGDPDSLEELLEWANEHPKIRKCLYLGKNDLGLYSMFYRGCYYQDADPKVALCKLVEQVKEKK